MITTITTRMSKPPPAMAINCKVSIGNEDVVELVVVVFVVGVVVVVGVVETGKTVIDIT